VTVEIDPACPASLSGKKGRILSDPLGSPSPPAAPEGPTTSETAVVSLVIGVLSWIGIPLLGGMAAVFLGYKARKEIRQSSGQKTGDGIALVGIALGYANLALGVLVGLCIAGIFIVSILSALYSS
jgi:hypothetical protein